MPMLRMLHVMRSSIFTFQSLTQAQNTVTGDGHVDTIYEVRGMQ